MTRSDELFARAKAVIPGGVSSPVRAFKAVGGSPLFVARAEGARFWDEDGRAFVDYVGSWGPHDPRPRAPGRGRGRAPGGAPRARPTARRARPRWSSPSGSCASVPSVEMVRFVSSGTEATMSALRLARGFTGRAQDPQVRRLLPRPRRLAARRGGLRRRDARHPRLPRRARGHRRRHARRALQRPRGGRSRPFAAHGAGLAGVIVEPVGGNMGCVAPAPGFLEALRELTRRSTARC